jgi:hypothetical protein
MSEQTQAASSPAEVEDVFRGETPTLDEFNSYRQSGELPARFKPAEEAASTTADDPEETDTAGEDPKPEPDSDPEEAQELKPKTAKRIQQLLAEKKELERKLAEKQDVKPESSPAPDPQHTRPEPTPEDKNEEGSLKFDTYEKYVKALARWEVEQGWETAKREQAQQEAQKALQAQIADARARYDDVDDVIFPAAKTINEAKIPLAVKEVFAQSDLFIDLCYVVGSDPDELKKFISLAESNPRAAIGKVFEYERGIREELSKDGKDSEVPETKKTSAPKPPSPVSGASSRAFDVSDESLSPEEWMRKRNADLNKRRG